MKYILIDIDQTEQGNISYKKNRFLSGIAQITSPDARKKTVLFVRDVP